MMIFRGLSSISGCVFPSSCKDAIIHDVLHLIYSRELFSRYGEINITLLYKWFLVAERVLEMSRLKETSRFCGHGTSPALKEGAVETVLSKTDLLAMIVMSGKMNRTIDLMS